MTLVDTNILIDIATRDPIWVTRSRAALEQRAGLGALLLLDVVFAELAAGFARVVDCSDFVDALGIEHASMSRPSLWLAGRAFREYRQRGGARTSVLPDFFIGAHASVLGVPLQTRDAGRYRTYFPDVELVTPA